MGSTVSTWRKPTIDELNEPLTMLHRSSSSLLDRRSPHVDPSLEDDDISRDLTRNILRAAGEVICERYFGAAASPVKTASKIDIALVDAQMPPGTPRRFLLRGWHKLRRRRRSNALLDAVPSSPAVRSIEISSPREPESPCLGSQNSPDLLLCLRSSGNNSSNLR
jgi:CheY-like chemotaxis protein